MKRIIMMLLVLAVVGGTTEVNAQSWLKKLGEKATEAAKRKVEQKVEQKTEQAVDDVFEGNIGKGKKNKKDKNNNAADNGNEVYDDGTATAQSGGTQQKSVQMSWNKFDFVAGDEVIFEDLQINEQMGEFPSQWDLIKGNAENMAMDNINCINIQNYSQIRPYMEDMKNYLPEIYTIEFDFYLFEVERYKLNDTYGFYLMNGDDKKPAFSVNISPNKSYADKTHINWKWINTSGEENKSEIIQNLEQGAWHRFSMSFNKRALKIYIDETRVINLPNASKGTWFYLFGDGGSDVAYFIRNVRIAQGAVPLYDRMMSDGKFITYGITFDVGKSTIKPESMGEINRIVQLMNENPDLKFSVEGHTDSTGNANSNQTLSEARSQAIVAKLVEMGIAADRLTAVGKGQNNPIADNGTDEGRAKNRRVEFVKL